MPRRVIPHEKCIHSNGFDFTGSATAVDWLAVRRYYAVQNSVIIWRRHLRLSDQQYQQNVSVTLVILSLLYLRSSDLEKVTNLLFKCRSCNAAVSLLI